MQLQPSLMSLTSTAPVPQRGPRACHFGSFWLLLFFLRSYIHKAQHTKRGTKSVWTGQVHLGLEPNKRRTWTTLTWLGFLPFGRTQEFTNRTHLLCLQQTGVPYRESWAHGCHYTFNVKSIEPCLQFRDMRTPCSLSPCHPWHSIVFV